MADLMSDFQRFIDTRDVSGRIPKPELMKITSWGLCHVMALPGIPLGATIEIYGPPNAGKTTIANYIISEAQRRLKKPALFVDPENKYNLRYGKMCGVNVDKGMFNWAHTIGGDYLFGEYALDMVISAVRSKQYSVVALDSIGGLTMKALFEGDVADVHFALEARKITTFIKKLSVVQNQSGTIILLLNQIRDRIGGYGSPEKSPGGWALEHNALMRIRVGRGKSIERGKVQIGYYVTLRNYKNGFGEPNRTAEIPLIYYKGIWTPLELLTMCSDLGLVTGRYSLEWEGKRIGLGRTLIAAARELMKYSRQLTPIIRKELMKREREKRMEVLE